ncbi:binding--dependent transport system inner membrane component family protein, partial [Vibrio cholerae CP1050(23)]
MHEPSQA